MAMISALRNQTATQNTDRVGKMLKDLDTRLVGTGLWRRYGAGDGLAASTTGTTDIFTANGGLGYKTDGTAWSSTVANSRSNPLAWQGYEELDAQGSPTGRQFFWQRSSSSAAGNERFMSFAISLTGLSGSSSATAVWGTGTAQAVYGAAPAALGSAGTNLFTTLSATLTIAGSGTLVYDLWEPEGSSAEGVAPFHLLWYVSGDFGGAILYEALTSCAPGDPHPVVFGGDTHANMYGESVSSNPASFSGSAQPIYSTNAAGTITLCSFDRHVLPNGSTYPGSSGTGAGYGTKFLIAPLYVWVDDAGGPQPKGVCESLERHYPDSTNYTFPATYFASVEDAVEPPRLSLGQILASWAVGSTPTGSPGNRTDAWRALPASTPDTTDPELTGFSPPDESELEPDDAVGVGFEDSESGISDLTVVATFSGGPYPRTETVFAAGQFWPPYDGDSTVDDTSWSLANVVRDPGWPGPFSLTARAVDGGGNTATESAEYGVNEYLPFSEVSP